MSIEYYLKKALRHDGQHQAFLGRYRDAAREAIYGSPAAFRRFGDLLLEFIADERNLMAALTHVERWGGPAIGDDGLRPSGLSQAEKWDLVRVLRDSLRAGTFRRGELLRRQVPKRPGSCDKRTIYIQTLSDRIVARGAAQILQPLLDSIADERSFCRYGRGSHFAIAELERLCSEEGRHLWLTNDLSNAFDNVPRSRLRDVLAALIPNDAVCDLVGQLSAAPTEKGILQGSSLSALLLNAYLDRTLHAPWQKRRPSTPLLRYMDDMLVVSQPGDDATALARDLAELTSAAGFKLKYPCEDVHDARTAAVSWLGYSLRLEDGKLAVRPAMLSARDAEEAKQNFALLVDRFARLHERPNSWEIVAPLAQGLLAHAAPAYPYVDADEICRRIVAAAAAAGCDLPLGPAGLVQRWHDAYERYRWQTSLIADVLPSGQRASSSRHERPELENADVCPFDVVDGTGCEPAADLDPQWESYWLQEAATELR